MKKESFEKPRVLFAFNHRAIKLCMKYTEADYHLVTCFANQAAKLLEGFEKLYIKKKAAILPAA